MKNWLRLLALLVGCFTVLPHTSYAATIATQQQDTKLASSIQLTLDGKPLISKGIVKDGSTLVPLHLLSKDLNLEMDHNPALKTVTIHPGDKKIVLKLEEEFVAANVNGHDLWDSYERVNMNGNNYVALRFITDNLGYRAAWNGKTKTVDLTKIQENDVTWLNQKIDESTKDATITVQYPQLSGLKDAGIQEQINSLFEKEAKSYVANAKEASKGAYNDVGFQYEYTSNYDIKYNTNHVISVILWSNEYTGGAHGMPGQWSYTINLETGKVYKLDDLLASNPNYKEMINAKIKQEIKPLLMPDVEFNGIREEPSFYVKDDGVVVYFGVYEYTPYAVGFPEFYMPFSTLLPDLHDKLPF
ncbi:hypothetical protein BVG16_19135 [Paenibacillus selenitireducens]|uniref:Copper amine oxidase n=1 Tax=Paenibacillus selenitireducens TaxID=1324314 RepID=A0A1T2X8U9_9BACL|nr:DUF4163 domain-containing protein [Paenibacillus selenitireducens]OPA76307.1 hypothetical protein BVG16_19135 [Paenibacillus selenitireducens]